MKITINTDQKTIELEEDVNLLELTELLEAAFEEEWGEYRIIARKEISYVPYYPYNPCPCPPSPSIPFSPIQPYYISTTGDTK